MLTNEELMMTCGGAINWGIVAAVAIGVSAFAIGFVDGFTRKLKCKK